VNESTDQLKSVRIDKWLWAVRVYKTRTQAADACRGGHVKINGQNVKPAHEVRVGETITAQVATITRTVKVLGLLEHRLGAAAAKDFAEDLTPASEYEKPRDHFHPQIVFRPKGMGRPTKKDRRAWENSGF
jgi:ribosome-associated heat shock protein Hsp15